MPRQQMIIDQGEYDSGNGDDNDSDSDNDDWWWWWWDDGGCGDDGLLW